jgi:hypothetical protein
LDNLAVGEREGLPNAESFYLWPRARQPVRLSKPLSAFNNLICLKRSDRVRIVVRHGEHCSVALRFLTRWELHSDAFQTSVRPFNWGEIHFPAPINQLRFFASSTRLHIPKWSIPSSSHRPNFSSVTNPIFAHTFSTLTCACTSTIPFHSLPPISSLCSAAHCRLVSTSILPSPFPRCDAKVANRCNFRYGSSSGST